MVFLCLFYGIHIFSQNKNDSIEEIIFADPEVIPEFRKDKSIEELTKFIATNLHYPASAIRDSIEGRVITQYWIDTLGNTYNHKILRGVREDLDKEALRVVRLLKYEVPAIQRGKPIAVMFTLPITFDLNKKNETNTQPLIYSNDEIRAKAKNYIISQSNEDFFNNLYELGITQVDDSKKQYPYLSIDYYIRTDYHKRFYYLEKNDRDVVIANEIKIHFDEQENIISYPNINAIFQGYILYQNNLTFSEKEIEELSNNLSKYKNMTLRETRYIYDLDRKQLYLEIIREKKFGTGIIEKQLIDIQTKTLIKSEKPSLLKRLF